MTAQQATILTRFAFVALMGAAIPSMALAQENGPIRSITLSSGGLAEIQREARLSGSGEVAIEVPAAQVDDVLKSLVVRDVGGRVSGISLDGPADDDRANRALPFPSEKLNSLPSLLAALQGTEVSASSSGKSVSGRVMGVETRGGKDAEPVQLLSVMTDTGSLDTLRLGADATVEIRDPAVREKVAASVAAAGSKNASAARLIRIGVEGQGERGITLSYVIEAPVWKAAYRVVADPNGKARMQAWGVLENATGEDWRDVAVTLSSGSPVTLKQRLHQRFWATRREVPVAVGSTLPPEPDTGLLAAAPAASNVQQSRNAMMAEAPMPAPYAEDMAQGVSTTASEGDVSATYRLPGRYDLADGQTLSVPIADADLAAELVSVYRGGQGDHHPVAAVSLLNGTGASLPPGIITVYDTASGYLGDAQLAGLPKGESRIAGFAGDTKVSVIEEPQDSNAIIDVKATDGMLRATVRQRQAVRYRVSGASDAPRTVIVEHPRMPGWTFSSDASDGETASHYRLRLAVPKGGTAEGVATQEIVREEAYALIDADAQQLVSLSLSAQDADTRKKIEDLAEARRAQGSAQRAIETANRDLEERSSAQARIRENLAAVPADSDQQRAYLAKLSKEEELIGALEAKREEAREAEREAETRVGAAIRSF